jgi:hypothetical protein
VPAPRQAEGLAVVVANIDQLDIPERAAEEALTDDVEALDVVGQQEALAAAAGRAEQLVRGQHGRGGLGGAARRVDESDAGEGLSDRACEQRVVRAPEDVGVGAAGERLCIWVAVNRDGSTGEPSEACGEPLP